VPEGRDCITTNTRPDPRLPCPRRRGLLPPRAAEAPEGVLRDHRRAAPGPGVDRVPGAVPGAGDAFPAPARRRRGLPAWSRSNGGRVADHPARPGTTTPASRLATPTEPWPPPSCSSGSTTEAVRTKSRDLELGHSLADFIAPAGPRPGPRRAYAARPAASRSSGRRLFRRETLPRTPADGSSRARRVAEREQWLDMSVAPGGGDVVGQPACPSRAPIFRSWVRLGRALSSSRSTAQPGAPGTCERCTHCDSRRWLWTCTPG